MESIERILLSSYRILIENQISQNRKDEYLFSVEEYLKQNDTEYESIMFVWKFFNILKKTERDLEIFEKKILEKETLNEAIKRLDTFCTDEKKSAQFYGFINQVAGSCEFLKFDTQELCALNLDQFRDDIEKIFLDIQKFLDES